MQKKAVILTIGNEILSGDVHDENSHWIAKRLFSLGVDLCYIFTIPDNINVISKYIKENKDNHDFVITIGGMGPTPDDVTKEAIANAFNVDIVSDERIIDLIQVYYNGNASPEKFTMAKMPKNSEPILTSDKTWAIGVKIGNVFSFPGTPSLVKDAFPTIEHLLKSDSPIFKTKININCEETRFADIMEIMVDKFPEVSIGSYPSNEDFRKVKLLFKSRNKEKIMLCRDEFISLLHEKFNDLEIS